MASGGLIGVPCAEQARWSAFHASLAHLIRPEGWDPPFYARGQSVASNRNVVIREALKLNKQWVCFFDDDTVFPPDLLVKLLAHGKEAVVALTVRRGPPFDPLWFHTMLADGSATVRRHELPPPPELMPIAWATAGGVLISTDVLKKMRAPWFTLGQMGPDLWNDDVDFFRKMREETGTQLYGATDCRIGHITNVEVWPTPGEAGWDIALARGRQAFATFSAQEEQLLCKND